MMDDDAVNFTMPKEIMPWDGVSTPTRSIKLAPKLMRYR